MIPREYLLLAAFSWELAQLMATTPSLRQAQDRPNLPP